MNETEWHLDDPLGVTGVTLAGRVDRVKVGPVLSDLKTASEIGSTWKSDYRQTMLRDFGLSAYDFYLCQVGLAPVNGRAGSPSEGIRYEAVPIRAVRVRGDSTAAPPVRAAAQVHLGGDKHAHESYADMKPWAMSTSACMTKFGACPFLARFVTVASWNWSHVRNILAIRAAAQVTA
jgi:hypothetical protein